MIFWEINICWVKLALFVKLKPKALEMAQKNVK